LLTEGSDVAGGGTTSVPRESEKSKKTYDSKEKEGEKAAFEQLRAAKAEERK